jgi:hypothetical protein
VKRPRDPCFKPKKRVAGDARGQREGVYEPLKRHPDEVVSVVRGESGLLENRPVIDAIVPQKLAQSRQRKSPDAVLPNGLVRQPVEVRPYAFVHVLPVYTAENCTLTVPPLLSEVKSSMISVNPIHHSFMTV